MMEYDLNKVVKDMVYDYLSGLVPVIESGKDRFTAADLAEGYGIHKDTARRMMNNGDFGEVITISPKNKVVTLEGLLMYERTHAGHLSGKPDPKQPRSKTRQRSVGRI